MQTYRRTCMQVVEPHTPPPTTPFTITLTHRIPTLYCACFTLKTTRLGYFTKAPLSPKHTLQPSNTLFRSFNPSCHLLRPIHLNKKNTTTHHYNLSGILKTPTNMPYIINAPGVPRPYITNNPAIYFDCLSWGWSCDARPFSDSYCKATRKREEARFEVDKRAEQLERYYEQELTRRERAKRPVSIHKIGFTTSLKPFEGFGRHAKHDSVVSVAVLEVGSDGEDAELSD